MSYRVVQEARAVLRPDYDAVFATEAEAQALEAINRMLGKVKA